jgi:dihydroxyacetone synthase
METRDLLKEKYNITARVVSFPVPRLFEQQSREYKQEVLKSRAGKPAVVIEAYAANGWERYADASYSMRRFGKSLPSKTAYQYFGFTADNMAPKISSLVEEVKKDGIDVLRGDFRDLNGYLGVKFEH